MITHKQLSLAYIFIDCQNQFDNDRYQFLSMLDQIINLDEIVPVSFIFHFNAATGIPCKHLIYLMLRAPLLHPIFSIPATSLLIVFLKYSQELWDSCGFDVVPDASKFTRFKQDFLSDLQSMFDHLVELTEPIYQRIDKGKASMMLFDTSGIEAWVTIIPNTQTVSLSSLKPFKKQTGCTIPLTLIKLPTAPCLTMPPLILPFSRCTSTVISVMPINSASSQTYLVLSGIFPFITGTS